MQIHSNSSSNLQAQLAARLASTTSRPAAPASPTAQAAVNPAPRADAPAVREKVAERTQALRQNGGNGMEARRTALARLEQFSNRAASSPRRTDADPAPKGPIRITADASATTAAQTDPDIAAHEPFMGADTLQEIEPSPAPPVADKPTTGSAPPVADKDVIASTLATLNEKGEVTPQDLRAALEGLGVKPVLNDGTTLDDATIDEIVNNRATTNNNQGGTYELHVAGLQAAWGETDSPYDLDGNGSVGTGDLLILLANGGTMMGEAPKNLTMKGMLAEFGKSNTPYDLNGDGTVDVSDLMQFLSEMGDA